MLHPTPLGEWERSFLANDDLADLIDNILTWPRFIDDIFIIWSGTIKYLNECIMAMNQNDLNLKCTLQSDPDKIAFLDVTILKGIDGKLTSTLYGKETAGNTILRGDSYHPKPLIQSIPYSQYLRIRRICSDEAAFQLEANNLKNTALTERLLYNMPQKSIQTCKKSD